MDHRFLRPLALTPVVGVFLETAGIDNPGGVGLLRPLAFAQVIDAGPHVIAGHVVVDSHKFPHLLELVPQVMIIADIFH